MGAFAPFLKTNYPIGNKKAPRRALSGADGGNQE
jgi:hypothetical protein